MSAEDSARFIAIMKMRQELDAAKARIAELEAFVREIVLAGHDHEPGWYGPWCRGCAAEKLLRKDAP